MHEPRVGTRNQFPDLRADFILANPAFNISDWWHASLMGDARWQYGDPPPGNANYAWLQHMLHHLKPGGRAGIVLANGLPLVLVELKNPADVNADVWKAFHQIETFKAQITDVFQYNEVLVISDGTDALLGSLSADTERYMAWRTIDGVTVDPLGPFNEPQTLVRGVLAPAYLLDYLRFFVLFEDHGALVKKIAGYHQFHAVRAAIAQVVAASRPDGAPAVRGKGGVVWHTQGSGKSITMTCFAARVMQEPLMANPTIVVITDRNDLDGQLFGVFSLAQDLLREQPVQATTRQELCRLLGNRPSGGIVFAIMTATRVLCSATTSACTTCSRPRKMAPRSPSTTRADWPCWA